jgi:hypothetical protein
VPIFEHLARISIDIADRMRDVFQREGVACVSASLPDCPTRRDTMGEYFPHEKACS